MPIWCRLLSQTVFLAFDLPRASAGIISAASIPMIAITIISSTSEKAARTFSEQYILGVLIGLPLVVCAVARAWNIFLGSRAIWRGTDLDHLSRTGLLHALRWSQLVKALVGIEFWHGEHRAGLRRPRG